MQRRRHQHRINSGSLSNVQIGNVPDPASGDDPGRRQQSPEFPAERQCRNPTLHTDGGQIEHDELAKSDIDQL